MLQIVLKTDSYPEETRFYLDSADGGNLITADGLQNNKRYKYNICVRNSDCVTLDFYDDYGDGLLDDGILRVKWNGQTIFNEWDLGFGFVWDLTDGCFN